MTRRSRRQARAQSVVERAISPIAATKGEPVKVNAASRCSCPGEGGPKFAGSNGTNPTCPVHGHGRQPGRGV